jgi:hypothetical protein
VDLDDTQADLNGYDDNVFRRGTSPAVGYMQLNTTTANAIESDEEYESWEGFGSCAYLS